MMRALIILALSASPALAAPCAPHDTALSALEKTYGETVQSRALQQNGSLIEMLANLKSGTWTVMITDPATGITCAVASGDRFTIVTPGDPA